MSHSTQGKYHKNRRVPEKENPLKFHEIRVARPKSLVNAVESLTSLFLDLLILKTSGRLCIVAFPVSIDALLTYCIFYSCLMLQWFCVSCGRWCKNPHPISVLNRTEQTWGFCQIAMLYDLWLFPWCLNWYTFQLNFIVVLLFNDC